MSRKTSHDRKATCNDRMNGRLVSLIISWTTLMNVLLLPTSCHASNSSLSTEYFKAPFVSLRGGGGIPVSRTLPTLAWDLLTSSKIRSHSSSSSPPPQDLPWVLPIVSRLTKVSIQSLVLAHTLNGLGIFDDESSQRAHASVNAFLQSSTSSPLEKLSSISRAVFDRWEKERSEGGWLHGPSIQTRFERGVDLNAFVDQWYDTPQYVQFGVGFGIGRFVGLSNSLLGIGVSIILFIGGRGGRPSLDERGEWDEYEEELKSSLDIWKRIQVEWKDWKIRVGNWIERITDSVDSIWDESQVGSSLIQEGLLWGILSGLVYKKEAQ